MAARAVEFLPAPSLSPVARRFGAKTLQEGGESCPGIPPTLMDYNVAAFPIALYLGGGPVTRRDLPSPGEELVSELKEETGEKMAAPDANMPEPEPIGEWGATPPDSPAPETWDPPAWTIHLREQAADRRGIRRRHPQWPTLMAELRAAVAKKTTTRKKRFEEMAKSIQEDPFQGKPQLERRRGIVVAFDKNQATLHLYRF